MTNRARLGTAVGELDDFLAELQAERLPRVAGGAATKNPNPGSGRETSAEKSLENALDLLMGGRDSVGSDNLHTDAFQSYLLGDDDKFPTSKTRGNPSSGMDTLGRPYAGTMAPMAPLDPSTFGSAAAKPAATAPPAPEPAVATTGVISRQNRLDSISAEEERIRLEMEALEREENELMALKAKPPPAPQPLVQPPAPKLAPPPVVQPEPIPVVAPLPPLQVEQPAPQAPLSPRPLSPPRFDAPMSPPRFDVPPVPPMDDPFLMNSRGRVISIAPPVFDAPPPPGPPDGIGSPRGPGSPRSPRAMALGPPPTRPAPSPSISGGSGAPASTTLLGASNVSPSRERNISNVQLDMMSDFDNLLRRSTSAIVPDFMPPQPNSPRQAPQPYLPALIQMPWDVPPAAPPPDRPVSPTPAAVSVATPVAAPIPVSGAPVATATTPTTPPQPALKPNPVQIEIAALRNPDFTATSRSSGGGENLRRSNPTISQGEKSPRSNQTSPQRPAAVVPLSGSQILRNPTISGNRPPSITNREGAPAGSRGTFLQDNQRSGSPMPKSPAAPNPAITATAMPPVQMSAVKPAAEPAPLSPRRRPSVNSPTAEMIDAYCLSITSNAVLGDVPAATETAKRIRELIGELDNASASRLDLTQEADTLRGALKNLFVMLKSLLGDPSGDAQEAFLDAADRLKKEVRNFEAALAAPPDYTKQRAPSVSMNSVNAQQQKPDPNAGRGSLSMGAQRMSGVRDSTMMGSQRPTVSNNATAAPAPVAVAPVPVAVAATPVPAASYNPAPTPPSHTERLQTKATIPIIAHPAAQIKTQSFKCKELTGTKQMGFLDVAHENISFVSEKRDRVIRVIKHNEVQRTWSEGKDRILFNKVKAVVNNQPQFEIVAFETKEAQLIVNHILALWMKQQDLAKKGIAVVSIPLGGTAPAAPTTPTPTPAPAPAPLATAVPQPQKSPRGAAPSPPVSAIAVPTAPSPTAAAPKPAAPAMREPAPTIGSRQSQDSAPRQDSAMEAPAPVAVPAPTVVRPASQDITPATVTYTPAPRQAEKDLTDMMPAFEIEEIPQPQRLSSTPSQAFTQEKPAAVAADIPRPLSPPSFTSAPAVPEPQSEPEPAGFEIISLPPRQEKSVVPNMVAGLMPKPAPPPSASAAVAKMSFDEEDEKPAFKTSPLAAATPTPAPAAPAVAKPTLLAVPSAPAKDLSDDESLTPREPQTDPPKRRPTLHPNGICRSKLLRNTKAGSAMELTLKAGTECTVLAFYDEWAYVRVIPSSEEGYVPASYLKRIK